MNFVIVPQKLFGQSALSIKNIAGDFKHKILLNNEFVISKTYFAMTPQNED